jgi:dephospho-CoA kinase
MQSIQLVDDADKKFAALAQLATVTGTVLPSGRQIPDEGHWFVQGDSVIKRLRIAFVGPMASGKSTMANVIAKTYGCRVKSFAAPVKDIARGMFGMTTKDRRLLQIIGMTGRALHPDTWANKLIGSLDEHDSVCVDDVRFKNEIDVLRASGFVVIYLDIPSSVRFERLKKTYGADAQQHIDHASDVSETSVFAEDADMTWTETETNALVSSDARCLAALM